MSRKIEWVSLVIVLVIALIFIIIVPLCFSDVQYYEYGIKKRRSTGAVDLRMIYTSGRHIIGPDYTFKTFRADAHFVSLKNVEVWTSDKVGVVIDCTFQYFLRREYLANLHEAYDLDYRPVVRSTALDAIKGKAANQPIDKYIRNREAMETELFKALLRRLDGCCRYTCYGSVCEKFGMCMQSSRCTAKDLGLFIEVKFFQLHEFDVHEDVKNRYLSQVIEAAEEERVIFVQQEKIVRKDTETKVNQIENEATIIAQNASAKAAVILAKAHAQALKLLENARTEGLKNLYNTLGLSAASGNYARKTSLVYLRTLWSKRNITLNVNYKSILLKG